MKKKEKRFICKSPQSIEGEPFLSLRVLVDTVTGVNYLLVSGGGVGGVIPNIIPLLDKDGKIVVDELPIKE